MLGKLFKHEFKNTAKLMLTIYAVLAALTALGCIFLSMRSVQNSALQTLISIILITYIVSLAALIFTTFIYMCLHFYKSMYTDQGYLTHTLPVSPLATLHVKLAVSFIWLTGSILLAGLSFLALIISATQGAFWQQLTSFSIPELSAIFHQQTGMGLLPFVLLALLMIFISCLSYLLLVFASVSIGQLFSQNKIAFSFAAGVAFYFIGQIINVVMILGLSVSSFSTLIKAGSYNDFSFILPFIVGMFIASGALIAVYYTTCVVIVRKHINLD